MSGGGDGSNRRRVVVLGGGVTGLSAAFYAQKLAREAGRDIELTVVERSDRFGGKINTLRKDGFVIEKGPDSFLARKTPILTISRDLGITDQLVATNPAGKKTYIVRGGKLHPMPPGLVLGIPTQLTPFLRSGLLSFGGKARAALDFVLPKRHESGDESLGGFLSRRLGDEVLQRIAEPLLAGIYAGDTRELSLQATFPQFQAAERNHRSLIRGMMASGKAAASAQTAIDPNLWPPALQKSVFLSYRDGLSTLVDALLEALRGARLVAGVGAETIVKTGGGGGYRVGLSDGEQLAADEVIVTLPLHEAAGLLPELGEMRALGSMRYVSVANVILAYDRSTVGHPLDGSGFLVPRSERRLITACTWTSSKWQHTAPPGKALLRCYVGRSGEEDNVELADDEMIARVRRDIRELMGIDAAPLFTEITRLRRSMPQYPVGHLDNVRRARAEMNAAMPGVYVTGAGFHGVGIPDCVRQGREAAQQLLERL